MIIWFRWHLNNGGTSSTGEIGYQVTKIQQRSLKAGRTKIDENFYKYIRQDIILFECVCYFVFLRYPNLLVRHGIKEYIIKIKVEYCGVCWLKKKYFFFKEYYNCYDYWLYKKAKGECKYYWIYISFQFNSRFRIIFESGKIVFASFKFME